MANGIADLTGVRAKLRRAKEHESTLKTEFNIWSKQQADALKFYIERDGPWYVVTSKPLKQPDIRFSCIVGDIIHNLRSALDHLIWQLVLRDGQEPSWRNEFPIYESAEGFRDEVKFRKKNPEFSVLYGITIDGDAWAIIEKAQPYVSGPHSAITIIKRFSNLDKHRTLFVQKSFADDVRQAIGWSQQAILLEERIATTELSFEHTTEIARYRFADQPDPNVHVKGGLSVSPTFGEGPIKGGYQAPVGGFDRLINTITKIVGEVSRLPRVIDV